MFSQRRSHYTTFWWTRVTSWWIMCRHRSASNAHQYCKLLSFLGWFGERCADKTSKWGEADERKLRSISAHLTSVDHHYNLVMHSWFMFNHSWNFDKKNSSCWAQFATICIFKHVNWKFILTSKHFTSEKCFKRNLSLIQFTENFCWSWKRIII